MLLLLGACACSPVEFDQLAIRADPETSGIPGHRYTRVYGRATNTSGSFVTIVVVQTELEDAAGHRVAFQDHLALSMYLEPGESAYFSSGGFLVPDRILSRRPRAHVRFLSHDGTDPPDYWRRFPAVRAKVAVEGVEFEPEADGVSVGARVVNRSGVPMENVIGSIALLDALGRLIAVEPFGATFEATAPDARTMRKFVPTRDGADVVVARVRVEAFRERRL